MGFVLQSPRRPSEMLIALSALADKDIEGVRIAVAYVTGSGYDELMPQLSLRIGEDRWLDIPKVIVTSLDFGLTDPRALRLLGELPNSEVRVANLESLNSGYSPVRTAWHPKMYIFDRPGRMSLLVGSANLTARALTVNTEAGMSLPRVVDAAPVELAWRELVGTSQVLDADLLAEYSEWRRRLPPNPEREDEVEETATIEHAALPVLFDAMEGGFDPASFDTMWVGAGSMSSGGSHNQLELPRGANAFFGYDFDDYGDDHAVIGYPVLVTRHNEWTDRKLTWHGNNRMERINLPTRAKGGFEYVRTAVLFRRSESGREHVLEVVPWDGPTAVSWRNASQRASAMFRLGHGSDRVCGFM